MKYLFLIVSIWSCSNLKTSNGVKIRNQFVEFELREIRAVKKGSKDIPVFFLITNKDSEILLNNPSCWGTSIPQITFNNKFIEPIIKVRIDPNCADQLVYVNNKDSIVLKYNYTLDQFIDLKKIGHYELQFSYWGDVFTRDKKKLGNISDVTNKISFDVIE